jgi:NCS1 family nucleobase:cation symporter-1
LISGGIHELEGEIQSPYINEDLSPTRRSQRTWATKDIAVLWISMCAAVPTYMLASGLIAEGMSWQQAVVTIFLGNVIVLIPMILNAHAGTKYGIPFPVYCRAAFGIRGANLPGILRALVACGWFGINAWVGGWTIYKILAVFIPSWEAMPRDILGISLPQLGCLLIFWAINLLVIYKGIGSIRILLNIKAPLLITLGVLLLLWAYLTAGGFGPMLRKPSDFGPGMPKEGQFFQFFFPALTGMVGYWATLALNIPDFSRYARGQRDQVLGQAIGLPTTMGLFSFIGVAVTSATPLIYGELIWDPVVLITKFSNVLLLVIALVSLCLATLATNIAANVVSPANDFAHVWPSRITFRAGGFIAATIGILIQPWRLVADPSGYIFTWLVGYSSLLGAVGGVLICDYYVLRKTELDLVGLYEPRGPYWYSKGWNPVAVIATGLGVLPCLPGFLGTVKLAAVPEFWMRLYSYAWFISFGVSFAVYALLSLRGRLSRPLESAAGESDAGFARETGEGAAEETREGASAADDDIAAAGRGGDAEGGGRSR